MMCERCWRDAFTYDGVADSQAERYVELVRERDAAGLACSPREQAGAWWDEERGRDSRAGHE